MSARTRLCQVSCWTAGFRYPLAYAYNSWPISFRGCSAVGAQELKDACRPACDTTIVLQPDESNIHRWQAFIEVSNWPHLFQ